MMTSSYLRSESADITAEALKESMLKQHCGSSSLILQAERPSADLQRTQEAPLTFDLTSDLPILRPRNKPSVEYKYGPSTDLLSPSVCWDQMMKAVQAAALFLMMMMMMMMMGSVSAFLLPPSFNDSRHADQVSPHLLNNSDSTRFESRQNNSLDDIPGRVASNTMNGSRSSPPMRALPLDTQSEEILRQPNKTDLDSTNRMVGYGSRWVTFFSLEETNEPDNLLLILLDTGSDVR